MQLKDCSLLPPCLLDYGPAMADNLMWAALINPADTEKA
jgi:hypothetical protein